MKDIKSAPNTLNRTDIRKFSKDILYFSLVPISFYVISVLTVLNEVGHVIKWADFIPTNATIIAIITWIGNQALNLIRKYKN